MFRLDLLAAGKLIDWSFNPSGGILVVQAFLNTACQIQFEGFNPSGGILVVQAGKSKMKRLSGHCFNPSGGILVVQARL